MDNFTVILERIVDVPTDLWRITGLLCVIAMVALAIAVFKEYNIACFVCIGIAALFALTTFIIIVFKPFYGTETQYLVQIDESTSYIKFIQSYDIKETVSDTLFWCVPKP